jgi:hypothetical protein
MQIGERWHSAELATIDKWIASQNEKMTRGQAIRRLVELALKAAKPAAKLDQRTVQEAAKVIDNMSSDLKGIGGKLGPKAKK